MNDKELLDAVDLVERVIEANSMCHEAVSKAWTLIKERLDVS
jgi:hypothetical protein